MRPRDALGILIRLAAGFLAALVVYEFAFPSYVAFLSWILDATVGAWQPPDLLVTEVRAAEGSLEILYIPEAKLEASGPGRIAAEQWYQLDLAMFGTFDLVVVPTLFAAFAVGPLRRALLRFALVVVLLVLLDVVSFGCLIRYGYDPSRDLYDPERVLVLHPFVQQVTPVLIWLLLCPMRLRSRLGASR